MALLTREQILGADDARYEDVPVPEWDGTVRLRSINGTQRDLFEQSLVIQRGNQRRVNMRGARARLVVLCAVDEDGARLFGDDDATLLSKKNAKPLDLLFTAAQKLCGISESDMDELVEDFEDDGQNGGSTTG